MSLDAHHAKEYCFISICVSRKDAMCRNFSIRFLIEHVDLFKVLDMIKAQPRYCGCAFLQVFIRDQTQKVLIVYYVPVLFEYSIRG